MANIPDMNNNPGNLKDPSTGQFRQFASPEEGYTALLNDLQAKVSGQSQTGINGSSTLYDFAKTYAPSGDSNDPATYAANLANSLGVRPDTQIGTLQGRLGDFAQAVAKNEGFSQAKNFVASSNQSNQNVGPDTAMAAGTQPAQESSGGITGLIGKGLNFLFPVAGDLKNLVEGKNAKSGKQILADTALSALPFIPGLGEAGEAARAGEGAVEAGGLLGKLAGSKVAQGAVGGYGIGALQNIAQGKSVGQSIAPNLGTIGGAITGGALNGVLGKFSSLSDKYLSDTGAIKSNADAFGDIFGATKTGAKAERVANVGNKDAVDFLAHSGIAAKDAVEERNGRLVVSSAEGSPVYKELTDRANSIVDLGKKAISSAEVQPIISLEDIHQKAIEAADKVSKDQDVTDEVKKIITSKLQGYAKKGGVDTDLSNLWSLKSDLDGLSSKLYKNPFASATQSNEIQAYKVLADTMRTTVEDEAEKAGVKGIKQLNGLAASHYAARDALAKLDGQTIKGGRLGGYFAATTGAAVGAPIGEAVASSLGGGLMGKIIGTGAGAAAGGLAGKGINGILQKFATNPMGAASIIGRMAKEDPEIVNQFVQYLEENGSKAPEGLVAPTLKASTNTQNTGLLRRAVNKGTKEGLIRLPSATTS